MTDRTAIHGTFVLERTYAASPSEVFDAFANPQKKRVWAHGAPEDGYSLDFRVGGSEHVEMPGPGGGAFKYEGTYFDIIENERLVYAYSFDMGGGVCGVTLTTVEFAAASDGGTDLKFTEQGAYLDGFDGPEFWESGTTSLLNRLGELLENSRH